MVKHMIIWNLKDTMTAEEKAAQCRLIKENLEGLVGKVPGLVAVNVVIDKLPSSNGDLMLDATLENAEALKSYAVHPVHVAAADTYVRPFTQQRVCMDFEI